MIMIIQDTVDIKITILQDHIYMIMITDIIQDHTIILWEVLIMIGLTTEVHMTKLEIIHMFLLTMIIIHLTDILAL